MIDLNPYLENYNEKIKLDSSREDTLRTSRDSIGDTIIKFFENNNKKKPSFSGQGSFSMKTTINPKDTNDEYDVDFGVYIKAIDVIPEGQENNQSEWITPTTVHNWIYEAVKNKTSQLPENKNKCIRVKYAPGETAYSYHVDLPIYVESNGKYFLAVKNDNEWVESDPKAIVEWFKNELKEKTEQLRVIVRFLKSWVKLQSWNCKKPTGLLVTILAVNEFSKQDEGLYDISLYQTVDNIVKFLEKQIQNSEYKLINPTAEDENLLSDYSEPALVEFKEKLSRLFVNIQNALEAEKNDDAFKSLKKCFSDIEDIEVTITPDEEKNYIKTSAPAIIGNDGRSA